VSFPSGFLWGAATAAHQVEGDNVNSDFWALEQQPNSMFAEPSGDAVDHYRLYREDVALLAGLGLNAYRFSIEWARVEPSPGHYSRAALAHYRDVLEACHEHGVTPVVTLHHFSSPRWLVEQGGWEDERTPERFAAYCETVMRELGDLIPYACTINEANIAQVIKRLIAGQGEGRGDLRDQAPLGLSESPELGAGGVPAAIGGTFLFTFSAKGQDLILRAHQAARDAVRKASPATQVGLTLALQDVQTLPGGEQNAERVWAELFGGFLPAIADDDFLGVQNYSRITVGPHGVVPPPPEAERTQMGYEYYPAALEPVLRRAAAAGLPLIVTESGVATEDDRRRVEFIRQTAEGLARAVADGVDVRGYFHWSALDNFEWMLGYRPTFGLIAVDRTTQRRTVKPSARYLGEIARRNAPLPAPTL
jgi:beta-glucosidase